MNKIATQQYVASLIGSSVTDGDKCATKKWITENYNGILIEGTYTDRQLVQEQSLYKVDTLETIFGPYTKTLTGMETIALLKPFNPSKGFEITMNVTYTRIYTTIGRCLTIHSQAKRETPREIQVYLSLQGVLSLGCITSEVGTYYHSYSGIEVGQATSIKISYDRTNYITSVNGNVQASAINPVDRECNYGYISGEKYYSEGGCDCIINNLIIKN